MVMLLIAYAGAMWAFLSSAPKVYTVMVSDLKVAQELYEGLLNLPAADVPLHYYYNYEQTLGAGTLDPLYLSTTGYGTGQNYGYGQNAGKSAQKDGFWYQLKKNAQLHVISGASLGPKNRQRHVCFDRDCLEALLFRIQTRGVKHKIRRDKPLNLLVKDLAGRVVELSEVSEN